MLLWGMCQSLFVPPILAPCRWKRVLFPRPPSSCVTASPVPEPRHISFEVSLSDRVGDVFQDTASGSRNLRTKRIMAFQRNRAFLWYYHLVVVDLSPAVPRQAKTFQNWKNFQKYIPYLSAQCFIYTWAFLLSIRHLTLINLFRKLEITICLPPNGVDITSIGEGWSINVHCHFFLENQTSN